MCRDQSICSCFNPQSLAFDLEHMAIRALGRFADICKVVV